MKITFKFGKTFKPNKMKHGIQNVIINNYSNKTEVGITTEHFEIDSYNWEKAIS